MRHVLSVFLLGLLLLGDLSCFVVPKLSTGSIRVLVHTGGGLVEQARVRVWGLDAEGLPNGLDDVEIYALPPLAEGYTNEDGQVEIDLALEEPNQILMIVATGGITSEPWVDEGVDGSFRVPEDVSLRVVFTQFIPYDHIPFDITVSPFTTIAATLAERWMTRGDRTYGGTMRRANELLGELLDDIDIVQGHPAPLDQDITLTLEERHSLALGALSSLAHIMAEASMLPVGAFTTLDLMKGLIEDGSGPWGLLDGLGPFGFVTMGECVKLSQCQPEEDQPEDPNEECKTICDLGANTLRVDLGNALVIDFLTSDFNKTGLGFHDVVYMADKLASADIPELFGAAVPMGKITLPHPVIVMGHTALADESQDRITFTELAVPVHEPSGAMIELSDEESPCPTVYKYVHRLNDADDNPLRWVFTVYDESTEAVGEYRVHPPNADREKSTVAWRPAKVISSADDTNRQYEVVLTEEEVPELSSMEGIFEIELHGIDPFGNKSDLVQRCWRHVPLAAPLDVGEANEAFGAGSLHSAGLEPGKMPLAPIINGVPVTQGLALMELSLRNGTDRPVYLTLQYEQPEAIATKDWILTSALLYKTAHLDAFCLLQGTCPQEWPLSLVTADPPPITLAVPKLIGGVQVWDVTENDTPLELIPCSECNTSEFLIPPRQDDARPRLIKIRVVSTHLAELAPAAMGHEQQDVYNDVSIDPEFMPMMITGRRYRHDDTSICYRGPTDAEDICSGQEVHVRYRALTAAALSAGEIRITGWTRSSMTLPIRRPATHSERFGSIDSFTWASVEEPLPMPIPQQPEEEEEE